MRIVAGRQLTLFLSSFGKPPPMPPGGKAPALPLHDGRRYCAPATGPPRHLRPASRSQSEGSCLAAGRLFFLLCPTGRLNSLLQLIFLLVVSCARWMEDFRHICSSASVAPKCHPSGTAILTRPWFYVAPQQRTPACRDAPARRPRCRRPPVLRQQRRRDGNGAPRQRRLMGGHPH
ncbi:hypothetical protein B0J13DRAFT_249850 [Dactylonectria estremocensis]|uniref:Uncharacterized protein n=1 Tax=Dactylonectria estremocensis TaxID=1079267 RepID=A0A9P9F2W6_9HYPO|nr:hypothetical protein B0J13DRAFT_249850 [Dactylonectria estremocensis]